MNFFYIYDSTIISYDELNSVWKCDRRHGMDTLKHFIRLNKKAFEFIGIKAEIDISYNKPHLRINTSTYAGTIPLLSPKNGKIYDELTILGRFNENISELLYITEDNILPEYNFLLPELKYDTIESPFYFECCKFIDIWQQVEKISWNKFNIISKNKDLPSSGTQWDIYANNSCYPEMHLKYPTRENKLSKYHSEFIQLVNVLLFAISEIHSNKTPTYIRTLYTNKTNRLSSFFRNITRIKKINVFKEHKSDPKVIKEAKKLANIIINNHHKTKYPWRMDYSTLFENYVQYIFKSVAKKLNYSIKCNPKYLISENSISWTLSHLEPDIILYNNEEQYVIDAKYKSHMFNLKTKSDKLKEAFRNDLHQILAYSSFGKSLNKQAILVYPSNDFISKRIKISNPISSASSDVYLIGIPLKINLIENTKIEIEKILTK